MTERKGKEKNNNRGRGSETRGRAIECKEKNEIIDKVDKLSNQSHQ
jgi:hypothetical protein